jgi:hypothetical protein
MFTDAPAGDMTTKALDHVINIGVSESVFSGSEP